MEMTTGITNNLTNVVGSAATREASPNTATIGKDQFMKLLLAQLKNQDPLSPMEGTDFAVQLAQFSSLEQLTNLNTELKSQGVNQATLGYAQSVNMIGKEVVAQGGNTIQVDGATANLNYELAGDAASVIVRIYDQQGGLVRTIEENGLKAGANSSTWDCTDMAKGQYSFQVAAIDLNGKSVGAATRVTGTVTAAHFRNNTISLTVNGVETPLSSIIAVKQPASQG
jgi:flagellar basal-body rod modification protein FlgD